ncbi:hypothetical protein [Williamwhitmania taraxaci]|uniref:Lipoprotein n=1 Tax=Williamwhitmania taraxaci TaxID=1640674 RepID=A0A1G6LIF3_9BACT|nr:hypothetical protein [Williamwhitmania taraxaci]SDC42737.1 hypothetical protein SAMN05216323_10319 [Williamwhitmania taraxaci]
MRTLLFLLFAGIITACSTTNNSSSHFEEDRIFLTRKYVGQFVTYRYTEPELTGMPNIIWIKTSRDTIFGKISAYSKKCDFAVGDRLYLKRTFITPAGSMGYWNYTIENNVEVHYPLIDYQSDKKVLIENWFE